MKPRNYYLTEKHKILARIKWIRDTIRSLNRNYKKMSNPVRIKKNRQLFIEYSICLKENLNLLKIDDPFRHTMSINKEISFRAIKWKLAQEKTRTIINQHEKQLEVMQ